MIGTANRDEISRSTVEGAVKFSSPKTIFIIVDSGMAIRNILRTEVLSVLKSCGNLRIVIFAPLTDDEFKKELGADNVFFEPLQRWKATPAVKMLRSLRKDIWSEKHDVARFREKREARKGRLLRTVIYKLLLGDRSPERIDKILDRVVRWETNQTPPLGTKYFEKYNPDLVFYSTIYAKDLAIELGAKQRNIKSCAYVLSWDNPTTKGPFPVRPDRAIVWNEIMRDEMLQFHEFRPEHLFVSGPPQFDHYVDRSAYLSREEFFRKWKLDPGKRLITYTTGTVGMFPFEDENVAVLYEKVRAGAFREPCQLLVRLHPKDVYNLYQRFENKPDLILQLPGRRGKTSDSWNPSREDMYGLAETMAYSDVVVNIASTITIDAACFDTPVVNVAYDASPLVPPDKAARRIYGFNHYRKIVETGGVKIANNIEETVDYIQRYLDNPGLEAEGRKRIREEQCFKFDGKAGERIGKYLVELLKAEKL